MKRTLCHIQKLLVCKWEEIIFTFFIKYFGVIKYEYFKRVLLTGYLMDFMIPLKNNWAIGWRSYSTYPIMLIYWIMVLKYNLKLQLVCVAYELTILEAFGTSYYLCQIFCIRKPAFCFCPLNYWILRKLRQTKDGNKFNELLNVGLTKWC